MEIQRRRTWREADGERIEGTWRHVFIRNGSTYFLTDLLIYADGMVNCWGLASLEEFADKLESGWVATELEEGAQASAHHLGSWKFTESKEFLTPEMLLGEVRDEIDKLNGRPDSTERCMTALETFRDRPTDANRAALREAFGAIPKHRLLYWNSMDWHLCVLMTGPGHRLLGVDGVDEVVTEDMCAEALQYFTDRDERRRRYEARVPADGVTEPVETSVLIKQSSYTHDWPRDPGILALRNEFPAPIAVGELTYPTVTHAYWALAVTEEHRQAEIRRADTAYDAQQLAKNCTVRDGWPQARNAVMANLLRAKFDQHTDLADVLTSTGTTRLIYNEVGSTFWGQHTLKGRNWMGRLLELVRSELAADKLKVG